jgi:hypothetical protein
MKEKTSLVIISVPFIRIAKLSLSNVVLTPLREKGDVLIVAPFANELEFKSDFEGENTYFMKWNNRKISGLRFFLLNIPEFMRRLGFWRKFKDQGLMYYFINQYISQGENGLDRKFSVQRVFVYWLLGILGRNKSAWKVSESFLGNKWYQFPPLVDFARNYSYVTLIQSANWGLQDRALARVSSKKGWRNVLLPYTTDQLFANGFLLNEFDAVCVQGSFEFDRAKEVHTIPKNRIYRLGSAWFRHMEEIKLLNNLNKDTTEGCIIYAGLLNTYFPSKSEFDALDALIDLVSNHYPNLDVVYRPVVIDQGLKDFIDKKYVRTSLIRVEWPTVSVLGLEKYSIMNQEKSLRDYLQGMLGCRLLVMSRTTSYGMDVAFQEGAGVISNMIDSDKILKKRHNHLFPTYIYPGLKIAHDIDGLIKHARNLLNYPEDAKKQSKEVISLWDYPNSDFNRILVSAVYGEKYHG